MKNKFILIPFFLFLTIVLTLSFLGLNNLEFIKNEFTPIKAFITSIGIVLIVILFSYKNLRKI